MMESYVSKKILIVKKNNNNLILTLGGVGEFSKVIQTLDYVLGLHNCRILQTPYVNTEKV